MGKIKKLIVHEARIVGLVSLYFTVCFGFIMLLKVLLLSEYQVNGADAGFGIVGALVIAKVVIILDKTSWGNRFERHAVWSSVLYKSGVYTIVSAMTLTAEKLFHAFHAGAPFGSALEEVWQNADSNRIIGTSLCIFVSFIGYNLLAEIARAIGWEKLEAFLFKRYDHQGFWTTTPRPDAE